MSSVYRVRATVVGVAGSPAYLTAYMLAGGGTAQQASTAFRTFLSACAVAQYAGVQTLMDPSVTIIESTTGQPVGAEPVTPGAVINGSSGGVATAAQVQLGIRLRTSTFRNGRRIQGHLNIPYVVGTQSTPSGPILANAPWSAIAVAAQALVDDTTCDWSVLSRPSASGGVGFVASIALASVSPVWFTLRSRLV